MTRNKDWLIYSQELIDIAELLLNKGRYSWSCFTSQQASTAALKAVLSISNESTFGDNLIALLRIVKETYTIPEDVKKACHYVNDFFTKCRDLENKPDGTPLNYFTLEDAQQAKNSALTILRFAHHNSSNS
ncbi:MAG: HEPN domain-containing protein [Candidatus Heimdallarchaeota archaeon]|nr:HEPN domain-containing protein [Candidatus Heimdallarchaeota archaeon]MBY8995383.1 HEPN domain-containing protein [Candidatus Heimdallarchaeota archaeon]